MRRQLFSIGVRNLRKGLTSINDISPLARRDITRYCSRNAVKRLEPLIATQPRNCFTVRSFSSDAREDVEGNSSPVHSYGSIEELADNIKQTLAPVIRKFERDRVREQVNDLQKRMNEPEFWDDSDEASKVSQQHSKLEAALKELEQVQEDSASMLELAAMAVAEDDDCQQILAECWETMSDAETRARRLGIQSLFDSAQDQQDCFLEINAGTGGKEAQDFAQMLLSMYLGWITQSGYQSKVHHLSTSEGGIKTALVKVSGDNMYGLLKNEQGTHRLVRVSKHDSQGKRHTSFAQVIVLPVGTGDPEDEVQIEAKDLKVETMRASGAGGQHVNTTDSAVRITHIPTGLVASCQNERSQHQNKSMALAVLKSRIADKMRREKQAEVSSIKAEAGDSTWGSQIRSYVLNPYQMVKDHRTGHECRQVDLMLSGDPNVLTPFIEANLLAKLGIATERSDNSEL